MNELTRREDNGMTGSIYHNCSMSQRPIRGDCEYGHSSDAGTGADVRKWKEEICVMPRVMGECGSTGIGGAIRKNRASL